MDIIHILTTNGNTFCGLTFEKDWPDGHLWIGIDNYNKEISTCATCREVAGLRVKPTNYLKRIDSIYAILSIDEGGEGVVGAPIGPDSSMVPLIAADKERLKDLKVIAEQLAKQLGWKMKIVRFTTREEIGEINS